MAEEWIMVRVKVSTHTKLQEVRKSMLLAADHGQRELCLDNRDRFSLDQVIGILIAAREDHAKRRRKSQAARKSKPASASAAASASTNEEGGK